MKYTVSPFFDKDYPITQRYGENSQIYTMFAVPGHEGVDYGTPNGTPVLSPFDGTILRDTFNDKDYGNFTVVWDAKQLCAMWFCHLQDVTTKVGDSVAKGQLLGHTNNTGNSTGPHCHVNFVETDAQGNRLNQDNGKQGFLDLLAYADITSQDLQAQLDEIRKARDDNWNSFQSEVSKNTELTKQLQDEQTKNQTLREANDKLTSGDADTGAQLLEAQHRAANLDNDQISISEALQCPNDLKSILTAIDTLKTPIDVQVKPLQDHALSMQKAVESMTYKKQPKKQPNFLVNLWEKIKILIGMNG